MADDGALVLDVREPEAFALGHLPGAGRIAPSEFLARRAELPPRHAEVVVAHDEPELARAAAEALERMGYSRVRWLEVPLSALPDGHADTGPAACVWRPSPLLARVLPQLPPGRSLDVACGVSRESVHLALHGWRAEAWDHDPGALERARALAARHGVEVTTRRVDLERGNPPDPDGGWDVIVVCRFLHRPLFPWLERALRPGGALVYETFREGQEVYGHPLQPRFLLRRGELSSAFPTLRVEHYEESEPEGGPVMARLLAFRP